MTSAVARFGATTGIPGNSLLGRSLLGATLPARRFGHRTTAELVTNGQGAAGCHQCAERESLHM